MKFFTNKTIWSKIILLLVFILMFQFVFANPGWAADDADSITTPKGNGAGKLMEPILSLFVGLGDGILGVLHSTIMGSDASLQEVNLESNMSKILKWALKITAVAAIAIFGGAALAVAVAAALLADSTIGFKLGDRVIESVFLSKGQKHLSMAAYTEENLPNTLYLPFYSLSPEEIFKGNILLFNVDFFSDPITVEPHYTKGEDSDDEGNTKETDEIDYYYYINDKGEEVKTSKQNIATDLRKVISSWYTKIRTICIVAMMIVLLYIGIRMLISTVASDKAKYQQLLKDWCVGLVLLFLMHYIMAFSVTITQKITDIVSSSVSDDSFAVVIPIDEDEKLREYLKENGMTDLIVDSDLNRNKEGAFVYFPTNLMGSLRLRLQLSNYGNAFIGYAICFCVLVILTLVYCFQYLRRVMYMAFLTVIAPFVALTYPIDKISDGSAQGFSKWFKEYIFNLLLQPLHLILYYVLITSAFELASTNFIYSLVAIAFMTPAEKLLRSLFGFEKAQTPGGGMMGGAVGGALMMKGLSKLKPPKLPDGAMPGKGGESPGMASKIKESNNISNLTEGGEDKADAMVNSMGFGNGQDNDTGSSDAGTQQESATQQQELNAGKQGANQKASAKQKLRLAAAKGKRKLHAASGTVARAGLSAGIKGVGEAGVGAVLATGGLIAGLTTGDPQKALEYTMAGAGVGAKLGSSFVDPVANMAKSKVSNTERNAEIGYNHFLNADGNEQFKQMELQSQIKKQTKEYASSMYENGFNKDEIKSMQESGTIAEYIKNDVNAKDAVALEKMRKNSKREMTQSEAIATAKYATRIGNATEGPDQAKHAEAIKKEFSRKGLNESQAESTTNRVFENVKNFNNEKKKVHN